MSSHRAFGPARWVILVHGGAGDIPAEKVQDHAAGCARAADMGAKVLREGGSAIDAVQAAVVALEDDPRFNAGTGACLNEEGAIELDASIMDGALRAGAVAAMPPFKNPIAIARAVLEAGRHVLYAADGAARFARAHGFAPARPEEMITEAARKKWQDLRAGKTTEKGWAGGTVGAVAKDAQGHVAAATSTGGMVDKAVGRVGDSPIVGAGTWADDLLGAVSTTGHGESFMRTAFSARLFDGVTDPLDVHAAARLEAMHARVGGTGGVILVDREGRAAWARITRTMSWALVNSEGATEDGA
ncbi:MAG: isoaspartyl peptidase/L-asparaginase family protein [Polyangiales bacterium]